MNAVLGIADKADETLGTTAQMAINTARDLAPAASVARNRFRGVGDIATSGLYGIGATGANWLGHAASGLGSLSGAPGDNVMAQSFYNTAKDYGGLAKSKFLDGVGRIDASVTENNPGSDQAYWAGKTRDAAVAGQHPAAPMAANFMANAAGQSALPMLMGGKGLPGNTLSDAVSRTTSSGLTSIGLRTAGNAAANAMDEGLTAHAKGTPTKYESPLPMQADPAQRMKDIQSMPTPQAGKMAQSNLQHLGSLVDQLKEGRISPEAAKPEFQTRLADFIDLHAHSNGMAPDKLRDLASTIMQDGQVTPQEMQQLYEMPTVQAAMKGSQAPQATTPPPLSPGMQPPKALNVVNEATIPPQVAPAPAPGVAPPPPYQPQQPAPAPPQVAAAPVQPQTPAAPPTQPQAPGTPPAAGAAPTQPVSTQPTAADPFTQFTDFFSKAEGWQKAAIVMGIPMALLGMGSSMFGEGGMGSMIMGILGLGTAAAGAGLFGGGQGPLAGVGKDIGTSGLYSSLFGGGQQQQQGGKLGGPTSQLGQSPKMTQGQGQPQGKATPEQMQEAAIKWKTLPEGPERQQARQFLIDNDPESSGVYRAMGSFANNTGIGRSFADSQIQKGVQDAYQKQMAAGQKEINDRMAKARQFAQTMELNP